MTSKSTMKRKAVQAERAEKLERVSQLDLYARCLRAWSHGANGTQLPTDISADPDAQGAYELGMGQRVAFSKQLRERLSISREELAFHLSKDA